MRPLPLALALLLAGQEAGAGAWPRGEGKAFLSLSHVATSEFEPLTSGAYLVDGLEIGNRTSLFAELGLTPMLTLGLDYGQGDGLNEWTTIVFLRRSFEFGRNTVGVELGWGRRGFWDGRTEKVIRPGLSWGRGTEWGWLGVETYVEHRSISEGLAYKLDATVGWRWSERSSLILQVQTEDYPGADFAVRLAPSWVRRFGEHVSVELGAVADVTGRDEVGLKLGTWLEF